jgi:hypothetical protein
MQAWRGFDNLNWLTRLSILITEDIFSHALRLSAKVLFCRRCCYLSIYFLFRFHIYKQLDVTTKYQALVANIQERLANIRSVKRSQNTMCQLHIISKHQTKYRKKLSWMTSYSRGQSTYQYRQDSRFQLVTRNNREMCNAVIGMQ